MGCKPLFIFEQKNMAVSEKQKDYEETLWRTSVAIKRELEPGARQVVELCGAKNFSTMISVMAKYPEKVGAALAPIFEEARAAEEALNPKKVAKARIKALDTLVKETGATPEQIKEALEKLRAQKQGAN